MSRPPIRDVFRLAHLGLEKVALACAAFSLMHATARAGESAPPELGGIPSVAVDQWAAQTGGQPADQAGRRAIHDDPWANPVAARLVHEDPWSANPVNPFRSVEQLHVQTPSAPAVSVPQTSAAVVPLKSARPSSTLVMDGSDWNKVPRGRSPGLIASNNAWRKRIVPEGTASVQRNVVEQVQRTAPAAVLKFDSNLQLDPWTAPAAASKGIDNAADWKNLNLASAHQGRSCNRDWSVFSGAGCPVSGNQADPAKDGVNGINNGPRPQPLPGMQSSKLEQAGNAALFRQPRVLVDAMADEPQPVAENTRSRIAMTADGRWRAPLATDAETTVRNYSAQRD